MRFRNPLVCVWILVLCVSTHPAAAGQEPVAPYGHITNITGPAGSNPSCIAVTNNSPTHLPLMVPSLRLDEWNQFISTTSVTGQTAKSTSPAGVSIAGCGCSGTIQYLVDFMPVQNYSGTGNFNVTFTTWQGNCTGILAAFCGSGYAGAIYATVPLSCTGSHASITSIGTFSSPNFPQYMPPKVSADGQSILIWEAYPCGRNNTPPACGGIWTTVVVLKQ